MGRRQRLVEIDNCFCKELDNKYFRFSGPDGLCGNCSVLLLQHQGGHGRHMKSGHGHLQITSFTGTGGRPRATVY